MALRYTPEEQRRKFWICDRKKCENCPPDCRYTLDINHALYPGYEEFAALSGGLYQKEPREGDTNGGEG